MLDVDFSIATYPSFENFPVRTMWFGVHFTLTAGKTRDNSSSCSNGLYNMQNPKVKKKDQAR